MCLTWFGHFGKIARMETRVRYWKSTLLAISATTCLPLHAEQEAEIDPFMEAMVQDQKKAAQQAAAEQVFKGAEAVDDTQAKLPEAYLTRPGEDVAAVTNDVIDTQLRGNTGIFSDESVYEGQRVASVSIRYISGKRVLPDSRLLDVIQPIR